MYNPAKLNPGLLLGARAAPHSEERAPRLRPNRDHKALPGAPDTCHICGQPGSARCPQCRLAVCETHQELLEPELAAIFGAWACVDCAARGREELAFDRRQWQRKRRGDIDFRTCAVCGQEFSQVLLACSQCGKRLCRVHRTRYRKRFRFGQQPGAQTGGWYWDYDVRCPDHRLSAWAARLKGWALDPTNAANEDRMNEDRMDEDRVDEGRVDE